MGPTVIPWDGITCHGVTVGMGNNADSNAAQKWKRDEQCSLLTLLAACCSYMDCKLVVLDWRWTKTDLLLFHVELTNTLCSVSSFTSVNLQ